MIQRNPFGLNKILLTFVILSRQYIETSERRSDETLYITGDTTSCGRDNARMPGAIRA